VQKGEKEGKISSKGKGEAPPFRQERRKVSCIGLRGRGKGVCA